MMSEKNLLMEGQRLIGFLGLAFIFMWNVHAYTVTIPTAYRSRARATTRDTKLFGAYEDYMDALQKQQHQYKSFMALNTASAYETEHLKVNVPPIEDATTNKPSAPSTETGRIERSVSAADDGVVSNTSSSRRYYFDYSDTAKFNFEQQDPSQRFDDSFIPFEAPSPESSGLLQDSLATSSESSATTYDETVKFNFEQQGPPTIDSFVSTVPPPPEYVDPVAREKQESFDYPMKFNFEQQEPPAPDASTDLFGSFGFSVGSSDTFAAPAVGNSASMPLQVSPSKRSYSVSSASWKSSPTVSALPDSMVSPTTGGFSRTSESSVAPSDVAVTPPVDSSATLNELAPPLSEPSLGSTSTFQNDYTMVTSTGSVNSEEGRPVFPSYVYESARTNPVTETTSSTSSSASTTDTISGWTAQISSSEYSSTNVFPISAATNSAISPDSSANDMDAGRPIFPSYTSTARTEHLTTDSPETNQKLATPELTYLYTSVNANADINTSSSAGSTSNGDDGRPIFPSDICINARTTDAISTSDVDPAFQKVDSVDMTSTADTIQAEPPVLGSDGNEEVKEVVHSNRDDSFSWSTASKSVEEIAFMDNKQSDENLDVFTSATDKSWGTSDKNRLWVFDELKSIDEKSTSFMSNESFLQAITSSEPILNRKELETANGDVGFPNFGSAPGFSAISSFWKKSSLLRSLELSLQNDKNSENDKDSSSASSKYAQATVDAPPDKPLLDTRGMTERIMKRTDASTNSRSGSGSGAGGSTSYEAFLRVEENWKKLKQSSSKGDRKSSPFAIRSPFVTSDAGLGNPRCWTKLREQARAASTSDEVAPSKASLDYDVVICGGTLGIFFALALLIRNPSYRICVVESAPAIRGRDQEWNISYNELYELVKLGVLTQRDVDDVITTEFPASRSGFKNKEITPLEGGYFENNVGYECVTNDVLNLGVSPALLLERVSQRFRQLGGIIREDTRLFGVTISDTVGAALDIGEANEPITTHLLLDCMGNASPISRQQRDGMKPDGVCAVVGSCAAGFDPITNVQGDIIYTMNPIQDKGENGKLQYFWEAFPVGIGRNGMAPGTSNVKTTYMFTYMDADEKRPSLETLMEDYWRMLPVYQPSIQNPETDLDVKRVLFAYFPTYTDSPLKPIFSRILPVGDASGIQSPLSFGGFGALTRHLDRIVTAVDEALEQGLVQKEYLGEINAYAPNLSAAWMFQKAMSVKMGQNVNEAFVNRLLAVNFEVMNNMGQRTIKPFLQDVIRFDGLVGSLARGFIADPTFMPEIVVHVGIPRLADWLGHVSMMGLYSFLDTFGAPLIKPLVSNMNDPAEKFLWRRRMDAWKFGCGNDYELPEEN